MIKEQLNNCEHLEVDKHSINDSEDRTFKLKLSEEASTDNVEKGSEWSKACM